MNYLSLRIYVPRKKCKIYFWFCNHDQNFLQNMLDLIRGGSQDFQTAEFGAKSYYMARFLLETT